jgi:hypothetical protein
VVAQRADDLVGGVGEGEGRGESGALGWRHGEGGGGGGDGGEGPHHSKRSSWAEVIVRDGGGGDRASDGDKRGSEEGKRGGEVRGGERRRAEMSEGAED